MTFDGSRPDSAGWWYGRLGDQGPLAPVSVEYVPWDEGAPAGGYPVLAVWVKGASTKDNGPGRYYRADEDFFTWGGRVPSAHTAAALAEFLVGETDVLSLTNIVEVFGY